jgi:FO synthase subunit 1
MIFITTLKTEAGQSYHTMPRRTITFSRNVFLPLTTVCRNRCGYCCFRTPVQEGCLMEPPAVEEVLRKGAVLGCTEALFTFGERPELEPGFDAYLSRTGYGKFLDYVYAMCKKSIDIGILPHTNAGILTYDEMAVLREVNASMGIMLETTAEVPAHSKSPGKKPEVRLAMMEDAGRLKIPFTTGLLLGIGETPADREASLHAIRDLHRRYGHIQEIIIQNFCGKPGTPMADYPGPGKDEICGTIRLAREILPHEIAIQIPPNLTDAKDLIPCGVDDLGGISPLTIDYVNPEHPWPEIDALKGLVGDAVLTERLCIYQRFIEKGWYHPGMKPLITRLAHSIERERGDLKQKAMLYAGKAKSVYHTDIAGQLIVEFRDDITAFDGGKKDVLKNKGNYNADVSAFFFSYLEEHGVKTHFVRMLDEKRMAVKKLEMIPLEVIVRNFAAGSIVRNYPFREGAPLRPPVIVIDYKDDSRHDPMLNDDLIVALKLATPSELKMMKAIALKVNSLLSALLKKQGITLVDFKLEFGKAGKTICLGDEISMDSMRLWDAKTGESLDKDVYRFDKGDVMAAYDRVARRITAKGKKGTMKKKRK